MLKIHKVIPPNRKIYRCDLCDYVCIKPNLIKEHRLRHGGKPALHCPHCDKVRISSCIYGNYFPPNIYNICMYICIYICTNLLKQ